jgi:group I intron endonuclease
MKRRFRIVGVYKIINRINDEFYIGSSDDVITRFAKHISFAMSDRNKRKRQKLHDAIRQFGPSNFHYEMIDDITDLYPQSPSKEELDVIDDYLANQEQHFINTLHPQLNTLLFASRPHRHEVKKETREKMAEAKRGTKQSPEHIEKRAAQIRGVPKEREHVSKTQEGKRLNKFLELTAIGEANRKDTLKKGDIRHMLRNKNFTDDKIRSIRTDDRNLVVIAKENGVSPATIKKIKIRKTYKDVPDVAPEKE